MKRRLLIAAIFLLAGAVVNVAVAWGCAFLRPPMEAAVLAHHSGPGGLWKAERYSWFGSTRVSSYREFHIGSSSGSHPADIIPDWPGLEMLTAEYLYGKLLSESRVFDGRGWPMRSMWCEHSRTIIKEPPTGTITVPVPGCVRMILPNGLPVWLPRRPIWPGFAINSLFYAALLWLPLAVRRWVRVRRGLCPACAYPRGESDVCSECGKALPGREEVTCAASRLRMPCWTLIALCVGLGGCHPPTNQDAFQAKVHRWVHVGMSVEAAESELERRSFTLWEEVWEDKQVTKGNLLYGREAMTLFSFPIVQVWSVRLRVEDGQMTSVRATTGLVGP